jgi:hypothetical protein
VGSQFNGFDEVTKDDSTFSYLRGDIPQQSSGKIAFPHGEPAPQWIGKVRRWRSNVFVPGSCRYAADFGQ